VPIFAEATCPVVLCACAVTISPEAAMTSTEVSADLAALVRSAQAGDRAALGELIAALRPPVFRYVLSRVGDRSHADDVTQEVAMTIVKALPRYVDTGHTVRAWAIGIANRKISESWRALGRRDEICVDEVPEASIGRAAVEPESEYLSLESAQAVAALLATLPHPQGDILRLRVAAGLSADETASVLGMTAGAVRVAQHRALTKLRAFIAKGGTS
jgi:RNA polymerase sigma-70 factor, ECF subfamily